MDTRAETNIIFFNPNYDKSVFYAERSFNKQINEFIQQNFLEIIEVFKKQRINFIYLPHLIDNQDYRNILNYNHPNLEIDNKSEFIANLYTEIIQKYKLKDFKCGLIAIKDYSQKEFEGFCNLNFNDALFIQILSFRDTLEEKPSTIDFGSISCCRKLPKKDSNKEPNGIQIDNKENELTKDVTFKHKHFDLSNLTANDLEYDDEIIEAEIFKNIDKLVERGALDIISKIIDKINANSFKISRLLITEDYKLYLKDYNMKLITMSPLEKSIFILYLNHPEGIPFKCLIDFHDELLSIYRNLTNRVDVDKTMESIRELTNPLSNSINEKVARIRAAFLTCLTQEIAKNYYITGEKGCPKKITLDRNLIEYQ